GADLELSGGRLSRTVIFHARLARELINAPFLSLRALLFGERLIGFFELLLLPVGCLGRLNFAAPVGIGLASEMKDGARANAAWSALIVMVPPQLGVSLVVFRMLLRPGIEHVEA